jgi:hypothetical protein
VYLERIIKKYVSFDADIPLSNATLQIFELQGRKIMTGIVENNVPVSVNHLAKGMYLYRISRDGTDYKGKFVIE